jgi:hypothetical protein
VPAFRAAEVHYKTGKAAKDIYDRTFYGEEDGAGAVDFLLALCQSIGYETGVPWAPVFRDLSRAYELLFEEQE